MLGRWIKYNGKYSKISFYDSNGWVETDSGETFDLHYINEPLNLKRVHGEEVMPEDWEPDKIYNYEIY